jgi:hypothetical protein
VVQCPVKCLLAERFPVVQCPVKCLLAERFLVALVIHLNGNCSLIEWQTPSNETPWHFVSKESPFSSHLRAEIWQ